MIRSCLIALAALGLAACHKDRPADGNQAFSDDDFTSQAIVANDVTAIDAATGDAANMAADVPPDAALDNGDEEEGAATPGERPAPRTKRPSRPSRGSDGENDGGPAATAAPAAPATAGNTTD